MGPQLKKMRYRRLRTALDDVGQIGKNLFVALHVAHLDLAGGKLVAARDQG